MGYMTKDKPNASFPESLDINLDRTMESDIGGQLDISRLVSAIDVTKGQINTGYLFVLKPHIRLQI